MFELSIHLVSARQHKKLAIGCKRPIAGFFVYGKLNFYAALSGSETTSHSAIVKGSISMHSDGSKQPDKSHATVSFITVRALLGRVDTKPNFRHICFSPHISCIITVSIP